MGTNLLQYLPPGKCVLARETKDRAGAWGAVMEEEEPGGEPGER